MDIPAVETRVSAFTTEGIKQFEQTKCENTHQCRTVAAYADAKHIDMTVFFRYNEQK